MLLETLARVLIDINTVNLFLKERDIAVRYDTPGCIHPKAKIRGLYYPENNTIVVCLNNISKDEEHLYVLKHETIHYGQHCIGKSLMFPNKKSYEIISKRYAETLPFYYEFYKSNIKLEFEAIYLAETYSTEEILELVSKRCKYQSK